MDAAESCLPPATRRSLYATAGRRTANWRTCMRAEHVVDSVQLPAGSVLSAQGSLSGAALAMSGSILRTRVYVDGFNLYYGAVKRTSYKWLNPVELSRQLVPAGGSVEKLKYFTARVSGVSNKGAPARQQAFLSALQTLPEVEIPLGSFLAKTIWRPVTNLPVAGRAIQTPAVVALPAGDHGVSGPPSRQTLPVSSYPPKHARRRKRRRVPAPHHDAVVAEVHTMEEKGSDVNLAVHLVNDAWKGLFDYAVVISNDTDLVEPIRMVTTELAKPVMVVCPGHWSISPKLRNVASQVRHIRPAMLRAAQFPALIPGTTISKPQGW